MSSQSCRIDYTDIFPIKAYETGIIKAYSAARRHIHKAFLEKCGFQLPATDGPGDIDHEALANIFMTPDTDMPKELLDALCALFLHLL